MERNKLSCSFIFLPSSRKGFPIPFCVKTHRKGEGQTRNRKTNHKQGNIKMMKTYKQRTNSEKCGYACDRREPVLGQRRVVKVDESQKEKTTASGYWQEESKIFKWQQRFNRWWDLIFGNEKRQRKVIGEIFRSLEILGTGSRMTKLEGIGTHW